MSKQEVDNRPSWHVVYMSIAFTFASRSLDPRTKHGCSVVNQKYEPLSFGFNSPPSQCDDSKIPLDNSKYRTTANSFFPIPAPTRTNTTLGNSILTPS